MSETTPTPERSLEEQIAITHMQEIAHLLKARLGADTQTVRRVVNSSNCILTLFGAGYVVKVNDEPAYPSDVLASREITYSRVTSTDSGLAREDQIQKLLGTHDEQPLSAEDGDYLCSIKDTLAKEGSLGSNEA